MAQPVPTLYRPMPVFNIFEIPVLYRPRYCLFNTELETLIIPPKFHPSFIFRIHMSRPFLATTSYGLHFMQVFMRLVSKQLYHNNYILTSMITICMVRFNGHFLYIAI
jgi:hypothetical protein